MCPLQLPDLIVQPFSKKHSSPFPTNLPFLGGHKSFKTELKEKLPRSNYIPALLPKWTREKFTDPDIHYYRLP